MCGTKYWCLGIVSGADLRLDLTGSSYANKSTNMNLLTEVLGNGSSFLFCFFY